MKIFVGNLSFRTTEQELEREFEAFGEVDSVKIIMDRETLKSRGFAFVEIRDQAQALAAIAGINGKELAGQILKANEARPKEARGPQTFERSPSSFGNTGRPGGYSSAGRSGGYGNTGRSGGYDSGAADTSIYDSKARSGGGSGNRGRGGRGSGSGGRSGGGKRSH
jgi:RNA recognition motif-containing protein